MASKKASNHVLLWISAALIGCCITEIVGSWVLLDIGRGPHWERHSLPMPPAGTVRIAGVEFRPDVHGDPEQDLSMHADPTGDTVYVRTSNGTLYSNTLFADQWLPAERPADGAAADASECAPAWSGIPPEVDEKPDSPPVQKKVLDSVGERFGHTMVDAVRCYVLYDDGTMEVWGYEIHSGYIFAWIVSTPVLAVLGIIVGIIVGGIILIVRNRTREKRRTRPMGVFPQGPEP